MGVVTKATEKEDEQVNFTKTLALLASYNWAPAPSCPKYGPHTSSISSLFWNFSEKQNFKPLPQRLTRVHLLPQNLHFNKISRWFLCTLMFEMVQFSSLLWFKNEKKKNLQVCHWLFPVLSFLKLSSIYTLISLASFISTNQLWLLFHFWYSRCFRPVVHTQSILWTVTTSKLFSTHSHTDAIQIIAINILCCQLVPNL